MKNIETYEEFKEVINKNNLVIIDFWAEWCYPCKLIEPVIKEIEEEMKDKDIEFYKLNVDKIPEVAAEYGILSIPTLLFFKNNKEVERIIGAVQKELIVNKIEKWI